MRTVRLALLLLALSLPAACSAAGAIEVEGGQIEGVQEDGLTVYRGIPFAAPPIGDLRWRPPQPVPDWDGVLQTSEFGPACMQQGPAPSVGMSEDCLYLNVWTPAKSATERLPVLVWIYGGGFSGGRTSSPNQAGDRLAQRGVVVVSIAYRVGSFGFLAHPGLSKESEHGVSGNYGLLDQIAGLRWIRDNIAQFGGDPERVTIFGESAGGIAVSMLSVSPVAEGLFHGAISQSGGSFGPPRGEFPGENMVLLPAAEKAGAAFAESLGASSIAEARDLSAEQLVAAARGPGGGVSWPIIDGWVIPDDQYTLYEAGRYNDTPILVGYNSDEGLSFTRVDTPEAFIDGVRERFGPFADRMLAEYPVGENDIPKTARDLARDAAFGWHTWAWARLQSRQSDSKVFYYYFDQHPDYPAGSEREGQGSPHGMDVAFVFDHLEASNRQEHPSDQDIADAMADYWTNFAKYGDPNGQGLPEWPEFSDETPEVMYFHHRPHVGPVPTPNGLAALEEYFAWRRTQEGKTFAGTATGIAVRKPVFGGA